jgi:WD40 repeat protein
MRTDGLPPSGTRRGDLYVWEAPTVLPDRPSRLWRPPLRAHDGPLQSVSVCADQVGGAGFATGGADGLVLLWSAGYA